MSVTADMCRAKADEAEWLSHTVAYEPDRERFRSEAASWRQQALRVEAHESQWRGDGLADAPKRSVGWFRRR